MTMTHTGREWREKEYPIRRLMYGTSWIGDVRVIRVTRQRAQERGPAREARTIARFAQREWSRKFADHYERIGNPEVEFSDTHVDLFIQNRGAYKVTQRAVERDADLERWLGGKPLSFNLNGHVIVIPVPVA
jgi:hypothetical protein